MSDRASRTARPRRTRDLVPRLRLRGPEEVVILSLMMATRGNTEIDWIREFRPVSTRRIRLTAHQTQIDVSRIWEVELFGLGKRE